jgi:hypothetical protein
VGIVRTLTIHLRIPWRWPVGHRESPEGLSTVILEPEAIGGQAAPVR